MNNSQQQILNAVRERAGAKATKQSSSKANNNANNNRSTAKASSVTRADVDKAISDGNTQKAVQDRRQENQNDFLGSVGGALGEAARGINSAYKGAVNTAGGALDSAFDETLAKALDAAGVKDADKWMDAEDVGNLVDAGVQIGTMFLPGGLPAKLAAGAVAAASNGGEFANALQGVNAYGDKLTDTQRLAAAGSGLLGTGLALTGAGKIGAGVGRDVTGGKGVNALLSANEGAAQRAGLSGVPDAVAAKAKDAVDAIGDIPSNIKNAASNLGNSAKAGKGVSGDQGARFAQLEANEADRMAKLAGEGRKILPENLGAAVRDLRGTQTNEDILKALADGKNLDLETIALAQERGILDTQALNKAAEAVKGTVEKHGKANLGDLIDAGKANLDDLIDAGISKDFKDVFQAVKKGEEVTGNGAKLLAENGKQAGDKVKGLGKFGAGYLGGLTNAILAYAGNGGNFNDLDFGQLAGQQTLISALNRGGAGVGSRAAMKGLNRALPNNNYGFAQNAGITNPYASRLAALKSTQLGSNMTKDEYGSDVLLGADLQPDNDDDRDY